MRAGRASRPGRGIVVRADHPVGRDEARPGVPISVRAGTALLGVLFLAVLLFAVLVLRPAHPAPPPPPPTATYEWGSAGGRP